MILDQIEYAERYFDGGRLEQALRLLQNYTLADFIGPRREIDGDRIFFLHGSYETEPASEGVFEAHRRYLDVMLMLEGCEAVYYKPVAQLRNVTETYQEDGDYLIAELDEDASKLILKPGSFLVLYPEDAHCPASQAFGPASVKKVIAKVLL